MDCLNLQFMTFTIRELLSRVVCLFKIVLWTLKYFVGSCLARRQRDCFCDVNIWGEKAHALDSSKRINKFQFLWHRNSLVFFLPTDPQDKRPLDDKMTWPTPAFCCLPPSLTYIQYVLITLAPQKASSCVIFCLICNTNFSWLCLLPCRPYNGQFDRIVISCIGFSLQAKKARTLQQCFCARRDKSLCLGTTFWRNNFRCFCLPSAHIP